MRPAGKYIYTLLKGTQMFPGIILRTAAASVAYATHIDPKLEGDVQWAIAQWSRVLVNTPEPLPMRFVVEDLHPRKVLGTFFGCSVECDIRIDPHAFPALVRVTLMHEIGHALGFSHGLKTPFSSVEGEFGVRSGVWVSGAHWSDNGDGLLMHRHINSKSRLSTSTVVAIAGVTGATPVVCNSNSDCTKGHSCRESDWPLPTQCQRTKDGVSAIVMAVVAGVAASLAILVIL